MCAVPIIADCSRQTCTIAPNCVYYSLPDGISCHRILRSSPGETPYCRLMTRLKKLMFPRPESSAACSRLSSLARIRLSALFSRSSRIKRCTVLPTSCLNTLLK